MAAPKYVPQSLDEFLSLEQAAGWLGYARPRDLADKTKGLRPEIPAFRVNSRKIMFHPRTVITVLASRAGVKPELIAVSFGLRLDATSFHVVQDSA